VGTDKWIETERMSVIPLDYDNLKLLLEDIPLLEEKLNIKYRGEPIAEHFRWIVRGQLAAVANHPDTWYWHTFWLFRRREDGVVMGSACFKDDPHNGAVEIGYGINSEFEGWGYTTEAVKAMCGWAFVQPGVRKVIAETDKDNIASQRVLQKCGMKRYDETEESYWWAVYSR